MSGIREFVRKVLFLFRRGRMERELAEEMEAHIEALTEENLREGMEAEEAERAARRQFGETIHLRASSRSAWGWPRVESFAHDVVYGLRVLRKSPAFLVGAVLSLALGIGANITVFGFLNGLFWGPIPGTSDSDELVSVYQYREREGGEGYPTSFSWPAFQVYREQTVSFEGMTAVTLWDFNVRSGGGTTKVRGGMVAPDYFSVLGVPMAVGRGLEEARTVSAADGPAVVLSHGYWQRELGGDRDILGGSIWIGGTKIDWCTGERECQPAPEHWHYCAGYTGPAISKDVWVWQHHQGEQDHATH